jgi:hypothetical protein
VSAFPFAFVAALALALAGCASAPPKPPAAAPDPTAERAQRLARAAYAAGDHRQAAYLYRDAALRAEARDDPAAAADARYDLAVSLLRLDDVDAALVEVDRARAALRLSGRPTFAELDLLEAALRYRRGEWDTVLRLAADAQAGDGAVAARAAYLRGLVAAERRDAAGVETALTAQTDPTGAEAEELRGRLALLQGRDAEAASAFERAADRRREALDYGGMARLLVAAGQAAERGRDPARAAALYLRAGGTFATRERPVEARRWLTRAEQLAREARQPGLAAEARARLGALETRP